MRKGQLGKSVGQSIDDAASEAYARKVTAILDSAELLEVLSAVEHDERWSGWHLYEEGKRGLIHPSGEPYLARWNRLALTPYRDLSERDKESDRIEVRKSIKTILDALLGTNAES